MTLNRRSALALFAGAPAAACATSSESPSRVTKNDVFQHGVASGDPATDSVVLWTRVSGAAGSIPVRWVLAEDEAMARIVASGETEAGPERDYTVHVIPNALRAGQTYYYQFEAMGARSPIGRTKTLPNGTLDRLGIALASCSNYAFGFFNAYDAIAKDDAIDIVLHTGDYIYEYGAEGWGKETAQTLGRVHQPDHEIVTLSDYRTRHAQYKTDKGSQAMHAAHPMVSCWDDHEVTNNPWVGGAQNHQPETEGDWRTRRDAALQAYFEWMPIRPAGSPEARAAFWRSYRFGDLATLVTLETRHTARGEQVDYAKYRDQITSPVMRDAFMERVIGDPTREMLSPGMQETIRTAMTASVEDGQPWRLFGNASPIARMLVPDLAGMGVIPADPKDPRVPAGGKGLLWTAKWNLPFYTDTWDGYPAARERFYDLLRVTGTQDAIFLTGDSHSFWANKLADAAGRPMGLELGTAGISSPGDFVESGWDEATARALDKAFAEGLDEVLWTDNFHQGYVRVTLTPTEGQADFVAVDTVLLPEYRTSVIKSAVFKRDEETTKVTSLS